MPKGKASGLSLQPKDIPTVLAMDIRGDRDHDIAAWFGVNQGRVAEAKQGKWGSPPAAPQIGLPPKGPPGIKGRKLRSDVAKAVLALNAGDSATAKTLLEKGASSYDAHEK